MVFIGLNTQWRYSMSGLTGIEYTSIKPVMDAMEVPEVDRPDMFIRLMILEREALRVILEQTNK